jgi:hypothetical protein
MKHILRGAALACCRNLAARFHRGETKWTYHNDWADIGLTNANCVPVLSILAKHGLIEEITDSHKCRFYRFTVKSGVVDVMRHREELAAHYASGDDLLAWTVDAMRRHRGLAWLTLAAIGLTAFLSIIASTLTILEKLAVFKVVTPAAPP